MSNRLVALALLIAFLPACATSRQARIAEGTLLTVASVAALATGAGTVVEGRTCEMDPEDCDLAGAMYVFGGLLLVAGAALGIGAAVVWTGDDDEDEDARIQAAVPPPPPPVLGTDGLPVRPTDDATRKLARQATRAASLRQCSAARVTLREIAGRDAAYHAELRAMPAVAACL